MNIIIIVKIIITSSLDDIVCPVHDDDHHDYHDKHDHHNHGDHHDHGDRDDQGDHYDLVKEVGGCSQANWRLSDQIAQIDNHYSISQSIRYVGIELLGQLRTSWLATWLLLNH